MQHVNGKTLCHNEGQLQRQTLNRHTEDESFVQDIEHFQNLTQKAKQVLNEAKLYPSNCMK